MDQPFCPQTKHPGLFVCQGGVGQKGEACDRCAFVTLQLELNAISSSYFNAET
jgi:hypothetical protein